jgi:hypothetical protein
MNKDELDLILEKSFKKEPEFTLPADFAQKLTFSIVRKEQWKNDLNDYLVLIGVLVSLFAVVAGFYYFIDKSFVLEVFNLVSAHIIQVILVGFILNFILFTDRVLLRFLFNKWRRI